MQYVTMPRDQGQTVEVSYGVCWDTCVLYRRTRDKNDGTETVHQVDIDVDSGSKFDPQNGLLPDTTGDWHEVPTKQGK